MAPPTLDSVSCWPRAGEDDVNHPRLDERLRLELSVPAHFIRSGPSIQVPTTVFYETSVDP
jgi:hypothetical protein